MCTYAHAHSKERKLETYHIFAICRRLILILYFLHRLLRIYHPLWHHHLRQAMSSSCILELQPSTTAKREDCNFHPYEFLGTKHHQEPSNTIEYHQNTTISAVRAIIGGWKCIFPLHSPSAAVKYNLMPSGCISGTHECELCLSVASTIHYFNPSTNHAIFVIDVFLGRFFNHHGSSKGENENCTALSPGSIKTPSSPFPLKLAICCCFQTVVMAFGNDSRTQK